MGSGVARDWGAAGEIRVFGQSRQTPVRLDSGIFSNRDHERINRVPSLHMFRRGILNGDSAITRDASGKKEKVFVRLPKNRWINSVVANCIDQRVGQNDEGGSISS